MTPNHTVVRPQESDILLRKYVINMEKKYSLQYIECFFIYRSGYFSHLIVFFRYRMSDSCGLTRKAGRNYSKTKRKGRTDYWTKTKPGPKFCKHKRNAYS